jgi:hypothetical protein
MLANPPNSKLGDRIFFASPHCGGARTLAKKHYDLR